MKWSRSTALQCAMASIGILTGSVSLGAQATSAGALTAEDRARLDHLIRHDCGSCHGMTLKGGLGPPLLPETLADRDEDWLLEFVLAGNPERAMPPWAGLLTATEARWIIRRLRQGLAEEQVER